MCVRVCEHLWLWLFPQKNKIFFSSNTKPVAVLCYHVVISCLCVCAAHVCVCQRERGREASMELKGDFTVLS